MIKIEEKRRDFYCNTCTRYKENPDTRYFDLITSNRIDGNKHVQSICEQCLYELSIAVSETLIEGKHDLIRLLASMQSMPHEIQIELVAEWQNEVNRADY